MKTRVVNLFMGVENRVCYTFATFCSYKKSIFKYEEF